MATITIARPSATPTVNVDLDVQSEILTSGDNFTIRWFINDLNPGAVVYTGTSSGTGSTRTLTRTGGWPLVKVGDDVTGAPVTPGTGTVKVTAIDAATGNLTVTLTGDATFTVGASQELTFDRAALDQSIFWTTIRFLEVAGAPTAGITQTWYLCDGTKYDSNATVANAVSSSPSAPSAFDFNQFLTNIRVAVS